MTEQDKNLHLLQQDTFEYFLNEVNPENGLIADSTQKGSVSSIAATGMALSAYPAAVERKFMQRKEAIDITLKTLQFFRDSEQSTEAGATGHKGFYYHFLDMSTGRRAWESELSTIDTTFLLAGMLTAGAYFDGDTAAEAEIQQCIDVLYRRVDWQWALNDGLLVSHGWKPEGGFLDSRWAGYCEALLLYILALGSPTHAISADSYKEWTSTYDWRKMYGSHFLYAGPLFIHQLSHIWIDFRNIQDEFMREKGIDYFENSRRATHIQQTYAIKNPSNFEHYGRHCWGITASDGPGAANQVIDGKNRHFYDYMARGVPGPDDGTIAPWAAVASLPFAPEKVLPTIKHMEKIHLGSVREYDYGFKATFNPTFGKNINSDSVSDSMWVSPYHYGLNQGPIILMIENYRSGLLWQLMKKCSCVEKGLQKAGFRKKNSA